jgi:hypothetical protein
MSRITRSSITTIGIGLIIIIIYCIITSTLPYIAHVTNSILCYIMCKSNDPTNCITSRINFFDSRNYWIYPIPIPGVAILLLIRIVLDIISIPIVSIFLLITYSIFLIIKYIVYIMTIILFLVFMVILVFVFDCVYSSSQDTDV